MKSYSQVYNQSKKKVLEERRAVYEAQKVAVVNVLKENYMITGKMSELDSKTKAEMARRLSEYWSPKTGINDAGVKLLNENMIVLSKDSSSEDIKMFIQKQVKKNLEQITESFRIGQSAEVVDVINELHYLENIVIINTKKISQHYVVRFFCFIDDYFPPPFQKMLNGFG